MIRDLLSQKWDGTKKSAYISHQLCLSTTFKLSMFLADCKVHIKTLHKPVGNYCNSYNITQHFSCQMWCFWRCVSQQNRKNCPHQTLKCAFLWMAYESASYSEPHDLIAVLSLCVRERKRPSSEYILCTDFEVLLHVVDMFLHERNFGPTKNNKRDSWIIFNSRQILIK